ncbi:MAG TPA: hypothetical protein VFM93_10240 [Candidatus Limnocylindria bacterium]|nr:hypothetical protein [Candidatus Limnocylindria bacterium]
MNITSFAIALVVAATMFALALTALPEGAITPPAEVFPAFGVLVLLESLAFGVGVAYVQRARRTLFGPGVVALERAVAWCVAYLLLAPWPHDFLHRITHINGEYNWPALAVIEYVFHFGIVPIGALVGAYLVRSHRRELASRPAPQG